MKNNLWDAIISYLALKFQRWIFLFLVFSWRESEILSDAWPHLIMLQWEEIDRLPTFERLKSSLFDEDDEHGDGIRGKRVVDVTKLGAQERHVFIEKLIKHIEHDNLELLHKIRKRMDK